MRRTIAATASVTLAVLLVSAHRDETRASVFASPDWPAVTSQTRPWTRWWWMGSAVDAAQITAELESFRAVGLGGVEVTPIYGASGSEARFIPYLSEPWIRVLQHTLGEARRLEIGVDMATGTGWPFGGPWVGEAHAPRALSYRTWTVEGGQRLTERVRFDQPALVRAIGNQIYEVAETARGEPRALETRPSPLIRAGAPRLQISDVKEPLEANTDLQRLALEQVRYPRPLPLQALMAYSQTGAVVDLTRRVSPDGTLDWIAPAGTWTLYGVFAGWHGKLVERAAPGGEGNVIDHFSRGAIRHYLARFDRALAGRRPSGLRAFFNDSYEVDDADGQADFTPALFDEFVRRRGYDVRRHLPALFGAGGRERDARVLADFRLTISELLLDTFTTEWRTWATGRGAIVRNQAHGSPGNLLDLYAASDIPETEGAEIARFKWATSAAHVAGRPLVSAEAATWLGEHFRTTLADVRAAIDQFFIAGVNHIVYHGTAYSAQQEPWPGWQFYASVEFNSRNPWWQDFAALNQYVTRAQSFLQAGTPDADILLYYPFYDAIAGGAGRLRHFGGANAPSEGTAFERASTTLQQRGFTYDFISDRQLASARVAGGRVVTGGGGSYKTLVVPASRFMPLETLETIVSLARRGAAIVAFKDLPDDVAGHADLERRRGAFRRLRDAMSFGPPEADGVSTARVGRGVVIKGDDLDRALARAKVSRETLVDAELQFTRRRYDGGRYYFIANDKDQDVDRWVALDDPSAGAVIFDPMHGRRADAESRRSSAGGLEVRLAIPRRGSLVVATTASPVGQALPRFESAGPPIELAGPWQVRFVSGGPDLPAEQRIEKLSSWTTFGGEAVARFSGTAVYAATFPQPPVTPTAWLLDLGVVRESARLRLNGRDLGTLIGPVFQVTLEPSQLTASNVLEISVSNLMANRVAALDKARVPWKKFYNVNFPARLPANRGPDGLFTAAAWAPLDSGLLGPVRLTPLK